MPSIRSAHQFGAVVRTERQRRNLTQVELAERSGVSRAWLARFEAGHRSASLDPLFRVLTALNLALTLTERTFSPEEQAIIDAYAAQQRNR